MTAGRRRNGTSAAWSLMVDVGLVASLVANSAVRRDTATHNGRPEPARVARVVTLDAGCYYLQFPHPEVSETRRRHSA